MARAISTEISTDSPRNTKSTTTCSPRPIANVPYGGMKKKLNARNDVNDETIPGPSPPIVTVTTTNARNTNPLLSGVMSSRNGSRSPTSAAVPAVAIA